MNCRYCDRAATCKIRYARGAFSSPGPSYVDYCGECSISYALAHRGMFAPVVEGVDYTLVYHWTSTPEENVTLPLAEETDDLPKCPTCLARFPIIPYIGFMRQTGFCSPACRERHRDPKRTTEPRMSHD
jgi:hypothetical protein